MLRRLFGRRAAAEKEDAPRRAEHPWELRAGDFLKFGYVAPHGLSRAELQVSSAHGLDLGGPGKTRRVLTLDGGAAGRYGLWRGERDALALSLEIHRPTVELLFDLDEFARLFDPDEPPNLTLRRRRELAEFEGWTAPVYRQEAALQAWRQEGDPAAGADAGGPDAAAEGLDHYRLVGDRRRFALEAAVFDGGRTEVALIALADRSIVEEMWPA